jgi:GNAT superfamily N-acetyltransferase
MTPVVSHALWGELSVGLHAARLRHFATAGAAQVRSADGAAAIITGALSNIDNGVVSEHSDVAEADAERLVAWVRDHGVPASWKAKARVSNDLHAALLRLGCREETTGVHMGARLAALKLPPELPAGVEVDEVLDEDALEAWLDIADACGWFDEPAVRHGQRALYASVGFGGDRPLRHWIAKRNGRSVAAATAFFGRSGVLLESLGVLAAERGRGIGTALVAVRLGEARRRGCDAAVLSPMPDSHGFYERLGFTLTRVPRRRWYYL